MKYDLYALIIKTLSSQKSLPIEKLASIINQRLSELDEPLKYLVAAGCLEKGSQCGELRLYKNLDVYCSDEILSGLVLESLQDAFSLFLFVEVDSTNTYLKSLPPANEALQVCLAERQLKGRGRRGKVWFSPFAENIYMSLRKKIYASPMETAGLSLVVGLAVLKSIEQLGCDGLQVKWPNDVYFQGKKIAGILIEMVAIKPDSVEVVVGIGVNVNMKEASSHDIDQQWTDLFHAFQFNALPLPSRNVVVSSLVNHICDYLNKFEKQGMSIFYDDWRIYDFLFGKPIVIKTELGSSFGEAVGINSGGELLVENESGVTEVNAGEVSVRLVQNNE